MARRTAKTMEVIEETLPEEQSESEAVNEEAERKAEAAVEAMEILGKIEDANRNVDAAAVAVDRAKQELKYRKEIYESHVERLRELCRTREERLPLLDDEEVEVEVEVDDLDEDEEE